MVLMNVLSSPVRGFGIWITNKIMKTQDFINKWRYAINYLNRPAVGIHVGWDIIPQDSRVEVMTGKEAWEKIYSFTPPWFQTPQTFQQLVDAKNQDFMQIVGEETGNGKIEYYRKNGLQEPHFCAFSNQDGSFTLLGDGNHRFLDCLYLIHEENRNFDNDLQNTTLDIIYLENLPEVLKTNNIWKN